VRFRGICGSGASLVASVNPPDLQTTEGVDEKIPLDIHLEFLLVWGRSKDKFSHHSRGSGMMAFLFGSLDCFDSI
jgi:hypothetical protein